MVRYLPRLALDIFTYFSGMIDCTYDKPSNRRRNPAPQYIEALEAKLVRAEALLRKFVPNIDLDDLDLDPAVQQEFQNRERQRLEAAKQKRNDSQQKVDQNEARITSMIETIGQLDLDEGGGWDFRGTSSGAVFLRRMKEHFGGLLGNDHTMPFLPRPSNALGLTRLDSPKDADLRNVYDLPPKIRAQQLTSCALTGATALLRIVHVPSFSKKLESIYSKPSSEFNVDDNRFLGLLYSVMAVGATYNITEADSDDQASYREASAEGCVAPKRRKKQRLVVETLQRVQEKITNTSSIGSNTTPAPEFCCKTLRNAEI